MSHQEFQELLGAYALDAVDPHEAARLEAHLAECPSCRAEVSAHRETAATLGNAGADAPARLWDRIAAELSVGQAPQMRPNVARPLFRRSPAAAIPAVLAVAAAVAIVLLGVATLHLQHRIDALHDTVAKGGLQQAAAAAVLDPARLTVRLTSRDGRMNADVVALPGGQAYLLDSNLPSLTAGRTYQLWGLVGGRPVSLGLLGDDPRLAAFRIDPAVRQLMVTAEPGGGRPAPDPPILIEGQV